jgi:phage gp29-like protein
MSDWIDRQISKLVLGQTMTTDDGSSRSQSETHDKVRDDIADSDIQQVVETLNAALTVPYINLNFGEQKRYPKIDLHKPDVKNIELIIQAVDRLGEKGLTVRADELRSLLGLANPDEGDDVIGGRSNSGAGIYSGEATLTASPALNATLDTTASDPDALDDLVEDGGGYVRISDDIAEVIEKAADRAVDFASFQAELRSLVESWPAEKIAECIAVATFKARTLRNAEFDNE